MVTPRDTCTPIEPILRSPAQTPVNGRLARLGGDPLVAKGGTIAPSSVARTGRRSSIAMIG